MKNIMRTMAVLVLLTGLLIVACKKDEPVQVKQNTNTGLDDHSTKVLALIKTFDTKMNSTLKGDELIELDSVIWNVEALQNYSYAFPDSSTRDFLVFSDTYTLSIDQNQMVLLSDVQALQSQMESDYLDHYNSINEVEKVLHFCDVALDSVLGSTAYISATHGFGLTFLLGSYPPFSEDDDWIWGTLGEEYGNPPAGKCDGTMQGVSDGSNELVWRLNYSPATGIYKPGGYSDLITIEVEPDDFEGQIYVDETYTLDNCLYNENLQFYLLEADEIIHNSSPLGVKPTGKNFVSIEIVDTWGGPMGNPFYCHYYYITYGVPYQNSGL